MAFRHHNLTIADVQETISKSAFHQLYCPEVLEVDNDNATLKLRVSMCEIFERQPGTGQWHGGVLSYLVDIAGCYALLLVAGGHVLTLNFSTDYLRLATSDTLVAVAKVRRVGRTVSFVDVDIQNEANETVVTGHACYAIQPNKPHI